MGVFKNLLGTVRTTFQLGLGGPRVKSNSGAIEARNAADNAYANMHMALARVFGEYIELNSDAAESGADWYMRLERPTTGMTTNIRVIMPTGTPSPNDVWRVASYSGGLVTMEYAAISAGATNQILVDETDLAFGSSSPLALLTKPANAGVPWVKIIIDEPFDGTPTVSIGISGQTSKYVAASYVDLTAAAGTVFDIDMGLEAPGSTEDLIATFSAGSATEGAARIQVAYLIPS